MKYQGAGQAESPPEIPNSETKYGAGEFDLFISTRPTTGAAYDESCGLLPPKPQVRMTFTVLLNTQNRHIKV